MTPLLTLFLVSAHAQTTGPEPTMVLARGQSGTMVSVADVLSELRRVPNIERQTILSKPEMVQQVASNLLVRRMLAAEALRDGASSDPVLAASIAISTDRILSDARLAVLDAKNSPPEAALDAYARNLYQVKTARFEKPAQTRARHILLAKGGADSLQKAKDLLAQLRAGASFEELAKVHSTDPGSAVRGGDLGFFGAGKMVQPFEDALNKLSKPGDLSEPVESEFGYHLIRLEERQEKRLQPFTEVRDQLLKEALTAIMNESRVQMAQTLTKDIVFQPEALQALSKSATP